MGWTTIDKAFVAGLGTAVTAFVAAQTTGNADLTTSLIAAAGGFVVGLLTWLAKNKAS